MAAMFSVKRAVVTGGAQGIGAAIGARLAIEGLDVALLDLDRTGVEARAEELTLLGGGRVHGIACDVSDRDRVATAISEAAGALGGIDTLVTNAGIARDSFVHKMSDDDWDSVISVHLTGTFACVRAAAPYLRAEGAGRVVTISSISAAMGNLGQANYTAAKGGIVSLTKTLAKEFARSATTVNCVRPGFIDTPMTAAVPDEARAKLMRNIPLGRAGRADEIAGVVAFLASDDAAFMTGAVLDVNGGDYM
jgi:3-oxoacyl-[acyl-carrier protein] reductase